MNKELAILEIESQIKWFKNRGESLGGYHAFYKDDYPVTQINEIYWADKLGTELARKRYLKITGKDYGDRRSKNR